MKCPCCHGTGRIALTPMQFKIWDVLRRVGPDGISASALTERIYADRADGGPDTGTHCIPTFVHHANKRLAAIGQRIVSTGGYRLEFFSNDRVTP
jgi:hypothetical protein